MSPQNFTVDDNSPLIAYTGWHTGNKTQDTSAFSYSDGGTFTVTQTNGSRASFTFDGTYIYIFGAKRPNHGLYSVEMDGVRKTFSGYSDEDMFQQLLYVDGPLDLNVSHTIHLQCDGSGDNGWLDLDYITWTTDLADADRSTQVILPDGHTNFSYTGPWITANVGGRYEGGSAHQSVNENSYVTLEFTGEAVSVYGAIGPVYGQYSAKLDGGVAQGYYARNVYTETQVLLYHANNIGNGTHRLVLANSPTPGSHESMLVDYAVVSTSEHTNIAAKRVQAKNQRISIGEIVGIVFGGIVLIAAVALLALIIIRRKRKSPDTSMNEVGIFESRDPLVQPYTYSGSQTPVSDKGRPALRGGAQPSTSTVAGLQQTHQSEGTLPPDYDMAVGPSPSRVRA